jgi:hypothetical protein
MYRLHLLRIWVRRAAHPPPPIYKPLMSAQSRHYRREHDRCRHVRTCTCQPASNTQCALLKKPRLKSARTVSLVKSSESTTTRPPFRSTKRRVRLHAYTRYGQFADPTQLVSRLVTPSTEPASLCPSSSALV